MKQLKIRKVELIENQLPITTEYIKLDSALKLSDIAQTGGHAKIIIEEGEIKVNGEKCLMRGKKLRPGDYFEYDRYKFTIIQADEY